MTENKQSSATNRCSKYGNCNKCKVLVTAKSSYLGNSFEKYASKYYADEIEVVKISLRDDSWRTINFGRYNSVFHVAGIAHADVSKVNDEIKKKYYEVNTDLAVSVAEKAKNDGVTQFIFMSSMIIYGKSAPIGEKKVITKDTPPNPENFYGDSKWQADKKIRELVDGPFRVAVVRPPMIYGPKARGNFKSLSKIATITPIFPDIDNERSVLYIDNFCKYICELVLSGADGIFFPQDKEYMRTSDMVVQIARNNGHKIVLTKLFNPMIFLLGLIPGKLSNIINKAFGSIVYDKNLS